jgi:hypothetical protein
MCLFLFDGLVVSPSSSYVSIARRYISIKKKSGWLPLTAFDACKEEDVICSFLTVIIIKN